MTDDTQPAGSAAADAPASAAPPAAASQSAPHDDAADPGRPGFGARLAAERERQGLAVGDIAIRLRLHANQIRALEAEDLAALPAIPYVRGFVRNYARELRIDPVPLLAALADRLPAPATIDALTGPRVAPSTGSPRKVDWDRQPETVRTGVLLLAVGLLIAFAVLGWIASRSGFDPKPEGTAGAGGGEVPAAVPAARPAEPVAPAGAEPPAAAGPVAPLAADGVGPTAAPVPVPAPATELAGTEPASAEPRAEASLPATGRPGAGLESIRLRFKELSWVEVRQHDGRVLLSQNGPAGSEVAVAGVPPLQVVIGNVAGVAMEVRGRPVDLTPYSRENVARLTIE